MKLLILSRAPYDGDRTKTCSNGRTVDTQGIKVVSSNKQQKNQMLTSHTHGLAELKSTSDNMINRSPAGYDAANTSISHNMQSYDEMHRATGSHALPLDLSGFKKTCHSSQYCPQESYRISESPLDLSVKTRKTVADSTGLHSVNNAIVSRKTPCEKQCRRNFELDHISQKREHRNSTIPGNTRVNKKTENSASYTRNGLQCHPGSHLGRPHHKKIISDYYSEQPQNSVSNIPISSSFDRSTQKVLFNVQQTNSLITPPLHQYHSTITANDSLNKADVPQNRSSYQHSLRVSPYPLLTPSPSLPNSPHSSCASPYLVPSSPYGVFAIPTSPGLSSAPCHTGLPNRISVLHKADRRIGDFDNDRSRVIQSSAPVIKSSVPRHVNGFTPPLPSQLPLSVDAQYPGNVDKHGISVKSSRSSYFTQSSPHYEEKTAGTVVETERSSGSAKPRDSRSPPTLSLMSPVIKPGNEAPQSPVTTMPVLSPHYKTPPGKTCFPPSAPPPLISFGTQPKAANNTSYYKSCHCSSSLHCEPYGRHSGKDTMKRSDFTDGRHGLRHKYVEPLRSEYGYNNSVNHKSKDAAARNLEEHCLNDGNNREIDATDHSRLNPQRMLNDYSETYRRQMLLKYIMAEHKEPQNVFQEQTSAATQNPQGRLGDLSSTQREDQGKFHHDTNLLPDLDLGKESTPPRSRFHVSIDHASTKITDSPHSNCSQEKAKWNRSKTNTDRQIYWKQQSPTLPPDKYKSASDQACSKPSLDVPVEKLKPVDKFVGSPYNNDIVSSHGTVKDRNSKSDLYNMYLPFMIHGQVLLNGSRSSANQHHTDVLNRKHNVCEQESYVKDWNNSVIDLTESNSVISETANNPNESNPSTENIEMYSSACSESNYNRSINQGTALTTIHDTNRNDRSVILGSCESSKGKLENLSVGKTSQQRSENNSYIVEKNDEGNLQLSVCADNKTCNGRLLQIARNDTVIKNVRTGDIDGVSPQATATSSQVDVRKTEERIKKLEMDKNSNLPITSSFRSSKSKLDLTNSRVSVKCPSEYEKMCPVKKRVLLSLEKKMQRRTTGIPPRTEMSISKLLKNESESKQDIITLTESEQTHIDGKLNIENHDAFDFCGSENEDTQSDQPRFPGAKRFAVKKITLSELSHSKESCEDPIQHVRKFVKEQEDRVSRRVIVPQGDPKQKKTKKLDVFQQIKAVGRRKRKYQTKKTILRCRQGARTEKVPSGECHDGRRPRKRYHKNEAYEEELAREEHRKAMLRAKRRQRQQEHDKPDDITLCSKRRQPQEHDKPDDVTLCSKRRQRQQEHDKPDDVTLYATRRQRQQEHDQPNDITLSAKCCQRQQEYDKTSLCLDDITSSRTTQENLDTEAVIQNKIDIVPRKRVGRPPKRLKKCSKIKPEVTERRRRGRPPKSASQSVIFKSKSEPPQKFIPRSNDGYRSLRVYDVNQDFSNTASGLDLDGDVDQLLGYENITQEGVSDDVFHLPVCIKDENKDDSDFVDDATVIYDLSDPPEVHNLKDEFKESLPLSVPPDLKRLQVNKNVGETVLHRAARLGYEDVIVYCLETGLIDVNVKDHGGYTALHECCVRGNLDVAKRLNAYGANVNSSAQDGTRPIHDAVACNRMEMVRLLLSSGADPTLATYSGRTCAKIAHTKEMKEFLRGYQSDINGGGTEDVCWEFHSSSILETANGQGFDILLDLPPDDDVMDLEPHFDISSQPHLPVYTLQLEADEGPSNYHLLKDVLDNMQMDRNEFFNLCGNVSIVTVTCDVFNRHVEHSQLLVSPWQHNLSGNDTKRNIQYVELVRLNDNLRKHLCITKDTLSSGSASRKSCEHADDNVVSGASYSDSISGHLWQVHNQSRDSYLSGFSDFLDTVEIESELTCGWNDRKVINKSLSKETPNVSPLREDLVHKNLTNVHIEFTNHEMRQSHMASVKLITTTQTFSHTGGNNTASISPLKGSTLKLANTTRGCFGDSNVSGSNNPTSDRHRSSPATGEDACTLNVEQECMVRDSIIGSEFQAQQTTHSVHCNRQKHK